MLAQPKKIIERHVKTHTQRSSEDASAVNTLETFLDLMEGLIVISQNAISGQIQMASLNLFQSRG